MSNISTTKKMEYVMQRYREDDDCGEVLTGLPAAFVEGDVVLTSV
jgi:hypothetical protein